ncbi:GtrA family protein [Salipiger mucosus]|uniref:GtrA-like protein n=1 Tax=Salipiger mucosus DSM 16094 TaxID=1123237 RepID=S9QBN0_9RHOB|nr:GtrA family protein [Salipiger mucosus]EPX78821.1 GtrA-like protein [Salipiger mucosus DSM 16094]
MPGLSRPFLRFAVVGGVGFVVDAGALYAFVSLGGDAFQSRIASFAIAVTVTWLLNRIWTFSGRGARTIPQEFASYLAVQGVGIVLSYAVFALVLSLIPMTAANAVLATACGSAVALIGNFFGANRLVFPGYRPSSRP